MGDHYWTWSDSSLMLYVSVSPPGPEKWHSHILIERIFNPLSIVDADLVCNRA